MHPNYLTDLYRRLHAELSRTPIIDCHEHLQRERELPRGKDVHIGRFFVHYANCDLISAGMPVGDMKRVQEDPKLEPLARWELLQPWYAKAWNTAYCESLRIALRDIYGFEDFNASSVPKITEAMQKMIRPGFTRKIFDKTNIEFALTNPFGPNPVFNPDFEYDCFICDMVDSFTAFPVADLRQDADLDILRLDDYLKIIDFYFERDAACASAFKVARAYDRPLYWEDVPRNTVEKTFNRLLAQNDRPDRKDLRALEDFILHYLCRKCGEYNLRMKFHTGLQEGNGNTITNSRAALMANLFLKYPKTKFDIYHISYPYHEELITLSKNFANVTIDFCWMWVINPAAARRALSDMLDTVPANKIHGFGGDYIFVEGTYGHATIARREIARVICEKVEEGRFTEDYAREIGQMLLRDNALENFDLTNRRGQFADRAGEKAESA